MIRKIKGQTRVPESGSTTESVNVFWMQPLTQISIQTQPEQREVMIMAVDKSEAAAQSDFDTAKSIFQNIGEWVMCEGVVNGILKNNEGQIPP